MSILALMIEIVKANVLKLCNRLVGLKYDLLVDLMVLIKNSK